MRRDQSARTKDSHFLSFRFLILSLSCLIPSHPLPIVPSRFVASTTRGELSEDARAAGAGRARNVRRLAVDVQIRKQRERNGLLRLAVEVALGEAAHGNWRDGASDHGDERGIL